MRISAIAEQQKVDTKLGVARQRKRNTEKYIHKKMSFLYKLIVYLPLYAASEFIA